MTAHRVRTPAGVVLAGGAGRRMGGAKAGTPLLGRPLIAYPLSALRTACAPVAVVAKQDSPLPPVGYGVELVREPAEPRHPLAGVIEALRWAAGRPVIVLACDLPLVDAALVRGLAAADAGGAPAVVATAAGRLQPLCARYEPGALEPLVAAGTAGRLVDAVAALEPALLEIDPALLLNVNDADGIAAAERALTATRT